MRVGIFTDTYPPFINGVSTSITMLQKSLIKKGHEVYIVTVNPENMSYKYDEDDHIIRIPGIPVGIYDYRLTGIYPIRAINKIKKWNLDIIHSHTEFGIGTFARIIAKQLKIPLVHTYHTMYEDYVHYITKGHFDKSSKKIVEYLTKFYCDKTTSELIVPSTKTYKLFKEKYKIDKNVHIVPTGVEVERFYVENKNQKEVNIIKKELNIKKDDFVILYVGRLAQEKNIELLIKAQVEISKKNKKCKLVIVGSGPDYEKYIKMVHDLKITNHVIFTNAIPWEEMPNYYHIASIFVTASQTETQGLTVIEAMAASLPVVCIEDESFQNVVSDHINGRIFHDQKEYEQIILKLSKDEISLRQMVRKARETSDLHSLKYYAESILDVYNSAIIKNQKNRKFVEKITDIVKKGFNE